MREVKERNMNVTLCAHTAEKRQGKPKTLNLLCSL